MGERGSGVEAGAWWNGADERGSGDPHDSRSGDRRYKSWGGLKFLQGIQQICGVVDASNSTDSRSEIERPDGEANGRRPCYAALGIRWIGDEVTSEDASVSRVKCL
jgi:hypothetical protein